MTVTEGLSPRQAWIDETTAVARYLPTRTRTTVGAWCFLDAYGPADVTDHDGMRVGPHPHTGLQTVTWLLRGDVVHRDSLGNEQQILPGQLNLMTAGSGVAHAEESPDPHLPTLQGVQCWVALPEDARHAPPAFAHHPTLPQADLGGAQATVLVGEIAGERSPAAVHTPLVGCQIDVVTDAFTVVPLEPVFEHALLAVEGAVTVNGRRLVAGDCVYLGRTRRQLAVAGEPSGRLLLLGGEPFDEPLVMWWNFVGRSSEEIAGMQREWEEGRGFGEVVGAAAPRVPAPPLPPGRLKPRGPAAR